MEIFSRRCKYDEFIEAIEGAIPVLLAVVSIFIFILLMHRSRGKSRELYWFTVVCFLVFDMMALGFSADYFTAFRRGLEIQDDSEL